MHCVPFDLPMGGVIDTNGGLLADLEEAGNVAAVNMEARINPTFWASDATLCRASAVQAPLSITNDFRAGGVGGPAGAAYALGCAAGAPVSSRGRY